ncbi:MAG: helix-turn-helix transcriptional regulator, partial [Planctomycetota bacterium]
LIRLRDDASRRGDAYTMAARCYGFLMSIRQRLEQGRRDRDPLAARALRLIEQAAGEASLGVSGLAGQLGVSREHLGRRFKQATGQTLSDAIVEAKLNRVVRELRDGDAKLQAIATKLGFGSASYLCRVFRKRYGITPGELRRRPWLAVP